MVLSEFLKDTVPPFVADKIREIKKTRRLKIARTLKGGWADKRTDVRRLRDSVRPPRRVIIIPGDQAKLFGSRGEDAMITAAATMVLQTNPAAEITVLTASREAEIVGRHRGFRTATIWNDGNFVDTVAQFFDEIGPDAVFVVGADL